MQMQQEEKNPCSLSVSRKQCTFEGQQSPVREIHIEEGDTLELCSRTTWLIMLDF